MKQQHFQPAQKCFCQHPFTWRALASTPAVQEKCLPAPDAYWQSLQSRQECLRDQRSETSWEPPLKPSSVQ